MAAPLDPHLLPDDLPVPEDDGACDHLAGLPIPSLRLASTEGDEVELGETCSTGAVVLYVYPRTGRPGQPLPPGWDAIPGARGCTPQSCAFRDLHGEIRQRGARVIGLSAQPADEQLEFAERERLPFPLLSDPALELGSAIGLPTFTTSGMTLYRRVTLVAEDGSIAKVFYPVFPPDRNASNVIDWLDSR